MCKIDLLTRKIPELFIKLIAILLIIFINKNNIVFAGISNWIEVSKTSAGIQYWDKDSLKNKEKGIIEIKTKYLNLDANNKGEIEENIYTMKIDCLNNKYMDISVNGEKNIKAKWEDPYGDKLINDVITESCENV